MINDISLGEQQPLVAVAGLKTYFSQQTGPWFNRKTQYNKAVDDVSFTINRGEVLGLVGESGSGKSTLLANLLKDGRFYGPSEQRPKGWFDKIFLFSPTANGDDIQKSLNIPKKNVFTDQEEATEPAS